MSNRVPPPRAAGMKAKRAIEVIDLASSDDDDAPVAARPQPKPRAPSTGRAHAPPANTKGRLKRTAVVDSLEWKPSGKEDVLEDYDVEEIDSDEEDKETHLAKRPRVISSQGQAQAQAQPTARPTGSAAAGTEPSRLGGSQSMLHARPASQDGPRSPVPSQPVLSQSQLLRHLLQGGTANPAAASRRPAAGRSQQVPPTAAHGASAGAAAPQVRNRAQEPVPHAAVSFPAPHAVAATDLWVDKHMPASEADLAVARKKVQEVRDWLDYQLPTNRRPGSMGRMLIVSGPPGSGKSTTVKLVAQSLAYNVVEWTPRAPVLWHELQYQGSGRNALAPSYTSKLDEFEMFVARAKFLGPPAAPKRGGVPGSAGALAASQPAAGPTSSQPVATGTPAPGSSGTVIMIDDLPHVHDLDRRDRLASALCLLAATARGPVIIITTEATGTSGSAAGMQDGGANLVTGSHRGLHKEVLEALQDTGAGMVSFNALTAPSVAKVLLKVAEAEGRALSEAAATSIASLSQGDLRAAMQTLQLMCGSRGPAMTVAAAAKAAQKKGGRKTSAAAPRGAGGRGGGACGGGREIQPYEARRLAATQRDQGLDLFHALGKFLYNKRNTDPAEEAGAGSDEEGEGAGEGHPSSRYGGSSLGSIGAGNSSKRTPGPKALATAAAMAAIRDASKVHDTGWPTWMPSFADVEQRLPASLRRPAMRYNPEAILVKAGLEPLAVTSFLHENYLNFIDEQELDDVAAAAVYLSDAAFLACYRPTTSGYQGFWGEEETTAADLQGACAASVATRGLMFANAHPAPRKWQPLQGPVHGAVDRARVGNTTALAGVARKLAVLQGTSTGGGCGAAIASQVLPWVRQLATHPSHSHLACVLPESWSYFWQGKVTQRQADGAIAVDNELLEQMGSIGLGQDGVGGSTEQDDPVED